MDPALTARLLALPALRKQAEEDGQQIIDAMRVHRGMLSDHSEGALVFGCESLLADLTRWQSQAWALREIGRLLGWKCGGDVPRIFRFEDGFLDVLWRIGIGPDQSYTQVLGLPDSPFAIFCQDMHFPHAQNRHVVAGIATMDRPTAIAAILLHLSERA